MASAATLSEQGLATWLILGLMLLAGNLTALTAFAAGRAGSTVMRRSLLTGQGLLLAALLGAAIFIPRTVNGGSGGAGAVLSLVGFVLALLLGGGLVYLEYVLSGRRDRFRADLGGSLWLGARGVKRLDGK